jgi:hypothetical protein
MTVSMEEKKTPAVDQVLWELGSGRGGGLLEPELCQSQRIAKTLRTNYVD